MFSSNKGKAQLRIFIRLAAAAYLIYVIYELVKSALSGESSLSTPLTILICIIMALLSLGVIVLTIIDWRRQSKAGYRENGEDPGGMDTADSDGEAPGALSDQIEAEAVVEDAEGGADEPDADELDADVDGGSDDVEDEDTYGDEDEKD
jgi:hypothetical protein